LAYKTFAQLYNDGLQQADETSGSGNTTAKTIIKAGINESYSEICSIRDWKTLENSATITTAAGTEEYTPVTSSGSVCRIRRISTVVDETSNNFLNEVVREKLEQYYPNPVSNGKTAVWYQSGYTTGRDIKMKFYPIPDGVYSIKVTFYEEPLELSADGDIPRIPDQFQYGLVYLGLAKYFEYQKEQMANYYRQMHEEFKRKILSGEYGDSDDMPQILPITRAGNYTYDKSSKMFL
jgi:hypothetical protein